jgi:hypothetical protein
MSFYFINIFCILDLVIKMSMKVWFIKEVHNKIQTNKNIEKWKIDNNKKNLNKI